MQSIAKNFLRNMIRRVSEGRLAFSSGPDGRFLGVEEGRVFSGARSGLRCSGHRAGGGTTYPEPFAPGKYSRAQSD
jgi:hypothetical protein